MPRPRLDKRLVAEAMALSLHPVTVSATRASQMLSRIAAGNRTAVRRAIGTMASNLDGRPSHVGERALTFLRRTLEVVERQA